MRCGEQQTKNTDRKRLSGIFLAIVILSVLFGSSGVPVTLAVTPDLMHNSANPNIGTTNYGTWGTTWDCTTCHHPLTTNLKLVSSTILAKPVVFNRITSTVLDYGILGDDNRTTNATKSQNVCEVCHHRTKYHQYSSSKILSGNKSHYNRKDCVSCHAHNVGFKAGCDTCHGNPPNVATTGAGGLAEPATGATSPLSPGAHAAHVTTRLMTCAACHTGNTMPVVSNSIQMGFVANSTTFPGFVGTAAFGSFSGHTPLNAPYSFVASNAGTITRTSAGYRNSCNVYCHGNWSGANRSLNPSWVAGSSQAVCGACHGTTAAKAPQTGSHNRHAATYSYPCATCHTAYADNAHIDGNVKWALNTTDVKVTATATYKGAASGQTGAIAPSAAFGSCAGIYCHSTGTSVSTGTLTGQTATVTWGATTINCASCHGNPPAYANNSPKKNSHGLGGHSITCDNCHYAVTTNGTTVTTVANHINNAYNVTPNTSKGISFTYSYAATGGTCSSNGCHINLTWGATGVLDCVGCHGSTVAINAGPLAGTGSRRAVAAEFKNTWSHKRSTSGGVPANTVVTKYDCCVCHMEGDMASGSPNGTYHGNGLIELRDPDTGATIKGVTHNGTATTAGSYTSTATDMTFARFSRDLGNASLEAAVQAIQINLCLKCHDNNGAASTLARVPTTGTAEKPFGTTIAGAGYTGAGVTANGVLGGVTDIKAAFATTNSSYHPVLGKQNNSYTQGSRMAAPWNLAKTNGNNTQYGNLISCWDCHAPVGASGVQTSTVTAHGSDVTLRGVATVTGTPAATTNQVTFCIVCHAGYDTSTSTHHGSGSALASNTNNGMVVYLRYGCNYCHSSDINAARPRRGEDVHGFNRLAGTGSDARWPTGATETSRPYAFIRNTVTPLFLTNHRPLTAAGELTSGSASCSSANTTNPCRNGMGSYTPGGVY